MSENDQMLSMSENDETYENQTYDEIQDHDPWSASSSAVSQGSIASERSLDFTAQNEPRSPSATAATHIRSTRPANRDAERQTDSYALAMRGVPLLTRKQEGDLGKQIRDSRLEMTTVLASLPAAWAVAARWAQDLLEGNRPLTDVFFAPFDVAGRPGATDDASGSASSWRDSARALSDAHRTWRQGGPRAAQAASTAQRLFTTVEPGFPLLLGALAECRKLDAQVRSVERKAGQFHADLLAASDLPVDDALQSECEATERTRKALKAVVRQAGVDLVTLRDTCRRAGKAERQYLDARGRMVNANLRLAHQMAYRLAGNGVDIDDLIQEAILGLMRAVDKFDHRLGYKFSTYATTWIRQTTSRSIAESSRTIRVATHMHDKVLHLRRIARSIEQQQGRAPTVPELAKASGQSAQQVESALRATLAPVSLDAPRAAMEDATLHDNLSDENQPDLADATSTTRQAARLEQLLGQLDQRDAMILRLRHGVGTGEARSLEDIGTRLGISRERARQLETRALGRLRELLSTNSPAQT